ncbi:MAG: polysaccharide biosynthesis/export family protein [Alistipes sp.]|nr:polysaccharide biosynthesis/export family protein [Alistipes sp.]
MKFYRFLFVLALLMCGCSAQQNVLYLQNIDSAAECEVPQSSIIRIKPLDQITVVVNSKNPELATPFNSSSNYNALTGALVTSTSGSENSIQVLTVDSQGYITMPIIGRVECGGMTREELARSIERLISEGGYIQDPSVNVRFASLTLSVVGEVNRPGRYDINKDKMTIFEALALAGDMTIHGKRDDVMVIREIEGKNHVTTLDLRSAEVFNSPCYYLEQNDVVIVNPNKYKAATSEINQNRSFWISLTSTAISLATFLTVIL